MSKKTSGTAKVAALAGTAALVAAGLPLAALAADAPAAQPSVTPAVQGADESHVASTQVRASEVVGTFAYDQATITPNANIRKAFLGTDTYLCGAQGGTSLASQPLDTWTLTVGGDVDNAFTATLADLADDSALTVTMGCACAANGADQRVVANAEVTGVRFADIMRQAGVAADANTVTFTTSDGYEVALPLAYVKQRYSLIVFAVNGEALENSMGGTNQLWLGSTSAKYFARDVTGITNVGVLSSEA